jgi:hypothetical protein
MKIRNTVSAIFGCVSFGSALLSSGVKECADWFQYAKPFILFAIVTGLISAIIYNWNSIRRVTYPAMICGWAWLYEHKFATSKFSKHTYKVYVYFGRSYKKFYSEVQKAFDYYLVKAAEV